MTAPAGDDAPSWAMQERLGAFFAQAGYRPVTTPVLQPVETFLELSGEDIRRRIFVTQDANGAELCLRPEFTIPVCRAHHLRNAGEAADYSYCGPIFRLTTAGPSEVFQAGIESIGREDIAAADAEILGFAIEGLRLLGRPNAAVRFGDMGLTIALLDALQVPPPVKRRTLRALAARRPLDEITTVSSHDDPNDGLLTAIEGQDPSAARVFVENVLSIAGFSHVGGRSAADIAERFLDKAAAKASGGTGLNPENRAVIERYQAIKGSPDQALDALKGLAREANLQGAAFRQAIDLFEERIGFIEARAGTEVDLRFHGGFARNLDYYTGFIFEIVAGPADATQAAEGVLVGGGRYDNLLAQLGSATPLPAVGCSFWLDRIVSSEERHA